MPPEAVTSTSQWLALHGACVTALDISYDPALALRFQQLPLATAPLVGLARLEVDGPDSLVALAPALQQLVALTHLKASVELVRPECSTTQGTQGVFSARGVPLATVPSLQQLCPGLKSLQLEIIYHARRMPRTEAPVAELLPAGLQQLHCSEGRASSWILLRCATLTSLTSLRRLRLSSVCAKDLNHLLLMPGLDEVDLLKACCWTYGGDINMWTWFDMGMCTALQHLTKLTGLFLTSREVSPAVVGPLLTAAPKLRRLELQLFSPCGAAFVEQLSVLSGLRQLWLGAGVMDVAALSALSCLQQLTLLKLAFHVWTPLCDVQELPSIWAEVLPHLPQLRVFVVTQELLLEGGLAAGLSRLAQLQCLYVEDPLYTVWAPPRDKQATPHLQVLSRCSSLRAVLCWSPGLGLGHLPPWTGQPLTESKQSGRVHLSYWYKWRDAALEGRLLCPRRCPHLPHVWELQEQEPCDG